MQRPVWSSTTIATVIFLVSSHLVADESEGASEVRRSAPSIDEVLLFQPLKFPAGQWEQKDSVFKDIEFESSDGTKLHGWFFDHDDPIATVLYLHGNAGNVSHRAPLMRYLNEGQRLQIFVFDYRGYGKSEGLPTVPLVIQDAMAARQQLAQLANIDEERIVLMGRSLGGAISIQLAAETPCRALIIESTFASLKSVAEHHFPRLAWLVPNDKLNSSSAISKHQGPLLHSHGDSDTVIPYNQSTILFQAANQPKTFVRIRGADHNHRQSPEYYRTLRRFFTTLPDR